MSSFTLCSPPLFLTPCPLCATAITLSPKQEEEWKAEEASIVPLAIRAPPLPRLEIPTSWLNADLQETHEDLAGLTPGQEESPGAFLAPSSPFIGITEDLTKKLKLRRAKLKAIEAGQCRTLDEEIAEKRQQRLQESRKSSASQELSALLERRRRMTEGDVTAAVSPRRSFDGGKEGTEPSMAVKLRKVPKKGRPRQPSTGSDSSSGVSSELAAIFAKRGLGGATG